MRQGPNNNNNKNRGRSRGSPQHGGGGGGGGNNGGNRRPHVPNRNQSFDSNGPDVRIRGSAYQVFEKYLNLARDATAAGDRIMAESYYQHAEHYYRVINVMEYGEGEQRRPRDNYNNGQNQQYNADQFGGNEQQDNGEQQGAEAQFTEGPRYGGGEARFTGDEPQPQPYLPTQPGEHEIQTGPRPREQLSDEGREEEFEEIRQPE